MNFKVLREKKLKLSQNEMAELLETDIDHVLYLDETNELGLSEIEKIVEKTGLDFNTILSYEPPQIQPLNTKDIWGEMLESDGDLLKYFLSNEDKIDQSDKEKYLDELTNGLKRILVKPSVSIIGRSDTGKSTLINSLLGSNKMPTAWTPTTAIAVYIKHINDRPKYIDKEVVIYRDSVGEEKFWNVKKIYDEEYCKRWEITRGEIELLSEYGVRKGLSFHNVGAAVVFLDSPVLLNCDIVDVPGYGTDFESDTSITEHVSKNVDILIYLSTANGFMRGEDIQYLRENIKGIPIWEKKDQNDVKPLSNLFIVATQAHTVDNGNVGQLNTVLKTGCESFLHSISDSYWDRWNKTGYKDYGEKVLPTRFFTYTTDIPSLCTKFEEDLKHILEMLPIVIRGEASFFSKNYIKIVCPLIEEDIGRYTEISEEHEKCVKILDDIKVNELKRITEGKEQRTKIKKSIDEAGKKSVNDFMVYYSANINVDALTEKMKKEKIKNKNKDIQNFCSRVLDEIENKCTSIIETNNKAVTIETQKIVADYEEHIKSLFGDGSKNIKFNFGYAFATSLAKLGIAWGIGETILGGTAIGALYVVSNVGLIALGPIGIAIGIAIAVSLGIGSAVGGGWQKSIAKKIIKGYEKEKVSTQYRNVISNYWKSVDKAYMTAADEAEDRWSKYVDELENHVNSIDSDEAENRINSLNNLSSILKNADNKL